MRFNLSVFVTLAIACAASAVDSSPSDSKAALDNAGIPKDLGFNFKPTGVIEVTLPQPPCPPSNSTDQNPPQSPPPPPSNSLDSTDRTPPSPSQSPPPIPSNGPGSGGPIPGNDTTLSPTFKLHSSGKLSDLGSGPYVIVIVATDAQSGDDPCTPKFVGTDFDFAEDGVSLKNNTPAVKDYQPTKTGKGGESHNLTALLYKQPNGTFPKQIEPASDCTKFNISQFAENFGVGKDDAIAGTIVNVRPGNNQTN